MRPFLTSKGPFSAMYYQKQPKDQIYAPSKFITTLITVLWPFVHKMSPKEIIIYLNLNLKSAQPFFDTSDKLTHISYYNQKHIFYIFLELLHLRNYCQRVLVSTASAVRVLEIRRNGKIQLLDHFFFSIMDSRVHSHPC